MNYSAQLALFSMLCVSTSCFAENHFSNPRDNIKTHLKRLDAVSCDKTATQCVAVGFGAEYHLHERLAYTTQDGGLTWSTPISLAAPKEEITPVLSDHPNPANISCNESGQNCIVTSSAIIDRVPTPIIYTTKNGGETWSDPMLMPLPKDVNKKQIYKNNSLFTAISCDHSGVVCTITGGLAGEDEAIPLVYTTKNAGETWKPFNSLSTPYYQAPYSMYHGTFLHGISCDFSGQNCVAVGYSVIATSFFSEHYSANPVVYSTHDSGSHWSKPIVLPINETCTTAGVLTDVSCDGSGMQCTTIGYVYDYWTHLFQPLSYTTRNGGVTWDDKTLITPKAGDYALNAIQCDDSGKHCVAVGWTVNQIASIPILNSLIYTSNDAGKIWEKETQVSLPHSSKLNDIFCNSTGEHCIAVGAKAEISNPLTAIQLKNSQLQMNHVHKPQKINE